MRQVHSYNVCYIGKEGWGKCGLPAFWISLNHMTWEWTSWTPTVRQESIEGQPPEERRSRCSSFSLAVSQQVPSDMLEVGMDQNLLFPIPYLDIFGGIRITIHLSACLVFTRVPEFWLIGFECETTLPWHPPLKEQELTKDLNIWNFLILRGGSRIIPPAEGSLVLMLLGSSVARMTLWEYLVVDQFLDSILPKSLLGWNQIIIGFNRLSTFNPQWSDWDRSDRSPNCQVSPGCFTHGPDERSQCERSKSSRRFFAGRKVCWAAVVVQM